MAWSVLISFLALMAISLGLGYVIAEGMVGREAAQRNTRYAIAYMLLGFGIAVLMLFLGRYGWVSFCILHAAGVSGWLISWPFRKQRAGTALLNAGSTVQNKALLGVGLVEAAGLGFLSWYLIKLAPRELVQAISLGAGAYQLLFWWSIVALFIGFGLSTFQVRENGICYMTSLIEWDRISAYKWELRKPNTLTIWFKPRFPLLPGFMSISISARHKAAVETILSERLPNKNR